MGNKDHIKGVPSFGHFLEYLSLHEFSVSVTHYARVQQIFDRLSDEPDTDDPKLLKTPLLIQDPEHLKGFLSPIFASSEEEQGRFSKLYDNYVKFCSETFDKRIPPRGSGTIESDDKNAGTNYGQHGSGNTKNNAQTPRRDKLGTKTLAAILVGVVSISALITFFIINPDWNGDGNINATVTEVSPVTPAGGDPDNQPPPLPTIFYLVVATGILLLFLLYALMRRGLRTLDRGRYENKRPPFKWPLHIVGKAERLYDSEEFREAARLLRRRQMDEFFRLDIGATISATIRSLGYPSFRYKPATRAPEYLALIERTTPQDHQARLFDEMVKALKREGIIVTRYFYEHDPQVCFDESNEHSISLEKLRHRHAGNRLLLFGSGEQLLDPITGRMADWTDVISTWHERAVLTPEPEWGWREHVLGQKFVVVPADTHGLLTLVNHLESPAARSSSGWPIASHPFPHDLQDPHSLDSIRGYLGPQVFQWLCACAVYTELRWELTLVLGSLTSMPNGVVNEDSLLRLSGIPWFRDGAIPDAMRIRLIERLDHDRRDQTRTMVVKLMENSSPPPETFAFDSYSLELILQRWLLHRDKNNLAMLRAVLKRFPSRQVSRNEVLANSLQQVPHRFFGRRLPRMFYRRGIPALGLSALMHAIVVLTLLTAALFALNKRADDVPHWAYAPFVSPSPTPIANTSPSPAASPPSGMTATSPPNSNVVIPNSNNFNEGTNNLNRTPDRLPAPRLSSPRNGGEIRGTGRAQLRWAPVSGARSYEVVVIAANSDAINRTGKVRTTVRVPGTSYLFNMGAALSSMPDSQNSNNMTLVSISYLASPLVVNGYTYEYRWRVTAINENGVKGFESSTWMFRAYAQ